MKQSLVPYLVAAMLGVLFVVNVHRAAVSSITADEAFTFERYVDQPIARTFTDYDANDHVLHSLLVRIPVFLFGPSELSVRLPALLGGLLYLVFVFRIARRLFGSGGLFAACVGLMALNPTVLDFLSLARGYSLALGFLMLALDRMLAYVDSAGMSRLYIAGMALGLAIGSNLTFFFPAAALAILFGALVLLQDRDPWPMVNHFAIPCVLTAFLVVGLPLTFAQPSSFYFGTKSLRESVESIVTLSFYRHWEPGCGWSLWFACNVTPVVTALAAGLSAFAAYRLGRADSIISPWAERFLVPGALAGAVGILLAAHQFAGVLYPLRRTGIYLIPLFVLACASLAGMFDRWKPVRWLGVILLAAGVAQFARQWETKYYDEWPADASDRQITRMIGERSKDERRVRVAVSWVLEPGINFYITRYQLSWIDPVTRASPDAAGYDYYVLLPQDQAMVGKRNLKVLYRDALSNAILAAPGTTGST